jgi:hypothetical protein
LLSRFSSLLFLPVAWLLKYVAYLLVDRPGFAPAWKRAVALAPWAAPVAIIAAFLVWAGYRFDVGRVDYMNATLPTPAFFNGIMDVAYHNSAGHLAYLLGQRSQTGFWYYYPVVLAVKTPLATLILMIVAVWLAVRRHNRLQIAMPLGVDRGVTRSLRL